LIKFLRQTFIKQAADRVKVGIPTFSETAAVLWIVKYISDVVYLLHSNHVWLLWPFSVAHGKNITWSPFHERIKYKIVPSMCLLPNFRKLSYVALMFIMCGHPCYISDICMAEFIKIMFRNLVHIPKKNVSQLPRKGSISSGNQLLLFWSQIDYVNRFHRKLFIRLQDTKFTVEGK
jgi:hypothetical protein